jgi:hypothetical protein
MAAISFCNRQMLAQRNARMQFGNALFGEIRVGFRSRNHKIGGGRNGVVLSVRRRPVRDGLGHRP